MAELREPHLSADIICCETDPVGFVWIAAFEAFYSSSAVENACQAGAGVRRCAVGCVPIQGPHAKHRECSDSVRALTVAVQLTCTCCFLAVRTGFAFYGIAS